MLDCGKVAKVTLLNLNAGAVAELSQSFGKVLYSELDVLLLKFLIFWRRRQEQLTYGGLPTGLPRMVKKLMRLYVSQQTC